MAKIVINISNDTYYRCKNERVGLLPFDVPEVCYAIKNGTPLPKGHGDLIDRNELNKDLITNEWITDYDGGGLEEILFNAPTIIEEDKENKNE